MGANFKTMADSYINQIEKTKALLIVSLAEAKKQCNVETSFTDDDSEFIMLIESARGAAEDYTGIDIAETTNTLELIRPNLSELKINEANYDSIVSITNTTDDIDTLITDYEIHNKKIDFSIKFNENQSPDKMVIVFKTGWKSSTIPAQVKSAILVKINDLYDIERTSYISGAKFSDNKTFTRLLNGFVINRW